MNVGVQSNVDQMIQGRIPGVNVTRISARPGGEASIRIRGATSIAAGNEPLYVIDGLPGAPLNALNPGDIESIEVLKDASAAAIYGSRGANGVILITTRQGSAGDVRIDYNGSWGVQEVAKKLDLLSGQEYMSFINDIRADRGQDPLFTQQEIEAIGAGTDWQNEVLRTAPVQNHQFSLSGGSEDTRYYLSLSHLNQQGIVISTDMKRYAARMNVNHSMDRFNFGLNLNTSLVQDTHVPAGVGINEGAGVIATAVQMDPVMPAQNEDGTYSESVVHDLDNPVAIANTIFDEAETNRVFGSFFAEYSLTDNLKAKVNFGSDLQSIRWDGFVSKQTKRGQLSNGQANIAQQDRSNYLAELTLSYDKEFEGSHRLNAVAGYTYQEFNGRGFNAGARNFPTDAFLPTI
jgi:TonB-dependent starch-binding outer membrane protein SusC